MILHNHFCDNTRSFLRGIPTNPALLQTDIGWETIFYGLLSSEWIELHQHTASHHGGTLEFATNLISVILQAVASRWRTRNETLHHETSNTPETRQRLINQIWALYECQLMVLPTDRQIFHQPLSALLEQPNQTLKTFLQHSKPLIQRSMKLYREQQQ